MSYKCFLELAIVPLTTLNSFLLKLSGVVDSKLDAAPLHRKEFLCEHDNETSVMNTVYRVNVQVLMCLDTPPPYVWLTQKCSWAWEGKNKPSTQHISYK